MNNEIKEKWCAALESGKYKQADSRLYNREEQSHCCLGVLRSVCRKDGIRIARSSDGDEYLQPESCERLTGLTFDQQKTLWTMNDQNVPFAEIAKHIRETY